MQSKITAVDLFCGAGGLSYGLQKAGVSVVAGVDTDSACKYPFERNIDAAFLEEDVRDITAEHLNALWRDSEYRLLAGCAPCQPFSSYRRGANTSSEDNWPLLREFGRLVNDSLPDFVTMENVPRIASSSVFSEFTALLTDLGYSVSFKSCYCPRYGLAQNRRRLVLLASRLGEIEVPEGRFDESNFRTVRDVIGKLAPVEAGVAHPKDSLHVTRKLSDLNLARIQASRPGGTWHDWPYELLAECHKRASGASFRSVYSRMEWDKPSPTVTTQSHNFGTGRFGHPDQDRAITLREAAMLQGFPKKYAFVKPGSRVELSNLGRLIGNAVPPLLGEIIGNQILQQVREIELGDAA
ncbi:DNA (cytosine-5-)-methyltransferase [Rhodococcus sp. no. 34]